MYFIKIINLIISKIELTFLSGSYLTRRLIIKSLKRNIGFARGILLDIGSGSMPYKYIFQEVVEKYITLDRLDTTVIDNIKPDIEGDILKIPLENESIDTILCTQVLEHVNEPNKGVSEMYRILKLGGYAYITVPLLYPIHMEHDFYRYTYKGITYLCESVGFEVIKVVPHGYFFTGIVSQINHFLYSFFMQNRFTKILFVILMPLIYIIQGLNNLSGFILDLIFNKNINYSCNYLVIVKK